MAISAFHNVMQNLCVGCGICLGLCPTNAIKLEMREGRLVPNFNISSCVNCKACISLCPALNNVRSERPKDVGNLVRIFFCYSTNDYLRYHGASGGVVTTLLLYMLRRKIVDKVFIVKMEQLIARPLITSNECDIISAQGSIYFKTFSLRCLRKLNDYVMRGNRVCVVGLPCQVSMLKRMLKNAENQPFFIGLICSHVNEIWPLEYISWIHLPKNSKIVSISHRKNGWPGKVSIVYRVANSTRILSLPLPVFWDLVTGSNITTPLGCLVCTDHLATDADIVVGDAWHPKFAEDLLGVSIVLVRTQRGLQLIEEATNAGTLNCESATINDLLIAQGDHIVEANRYVPFRKKLIREKFYDALCESLSPDKTVIALQYLLNRLALHNKNLRQLLYLPPIMALLSIIQKILYIKMRKIKRSLSVRTQPNLT